jgi:endo-1,4-beta-xylanase
VVGSCLDVEGCVGVTIWGVSDKYSWVPNTFSGAGEALIYNDQYEKKPAWTSISSLLAAAATGSSGKASSVEASSVVATAEATSVEVSSVVATADATSVAPVVETTAPATTLETRTKPVVSISEAAPAPEPTSLIVTPFLNNTATQTTLEIRTSAAAPIASEIGDDEDYEGDEDCEEEGEGEDEDEDSQDDEDCEDEEEQPEPFPTYAVPGNSTTPINGTVPYNSQAPVSEAAAASVTESPAEPTVRVPIIRHSSSAYNYPWNTQPAASGPAVPAPTGTAPSAPIGTGTTELVKHYYQCGGRNWDGPTQCEAPYVCEEHNEWYHQCV